ncbi:MAG: L-2-hydroxyglutarate oxidase [Candidatus Eisenbacteria bacterium]|uniref:L-2-hydroxyglutarate oxidase n=1 Tax=Eiseniibacteriota bacterium TaxID=2212470 RepID=A0A938BM54_UNCEI|nr:L-2-hydroxyglutarate oxidase [Candidatus Eisenbacteria bacterium]
METAHPFAMSLEADIVVVGGGIVGVATTAALAGALEGDADAEAGRAHASAAGPGMAAPRGSAGTGRVLLLEAEERLAAHQTGHNSGVVHSGLYYRPGSLKARTCAAGREALVRFCAVHGIPLERCGKVVVATRERELPALDELERRGRANGLRGLRRLLPAEIRAREPHAAGIAGLLVEETGVVDYGAVTARLAELARARGATILLGARLLRARREASGLSLETASGRVRCRLLVNCAGLQADRVARMCGVDPGLRIVPFRGEYYALVPGRRDLVRHLIYPVPDPALPFLGVHFTRRIDGRVEAGPNAVLALKREGYAKSSFAAADAWETLAYAGFRRLAARFWRSGLGEWRRSQCKRGFAAALQRLVPEVRPGDLVPAHAGVRAQAVSPAGELIDDFRIVESGGMIHVLNAPSPAATAALDIGARIADLARRRLAG